jgi:inositol hexakisphosphate/diphosphoinositol-pentakisphosphate kinase
VLSSGKGGKGSEHAQEVIELLSGFRATMGRNFDTLDVEKIQERW